MEPLPLNCSKETINAPASFAATRAAIGVAAMNGFNASLRYAETTYLQAAIGSPTRTPTFVELPWEWWPDNWFVDDAKRQILKYDRPHCRLLRAPYGHPETGALWEPKLGDIMKSLGWSLSRETVASMYMPKRRPRWWSA